MYFSCKQHFKCFMLLGFSTCELTKTDCTHCDMSASPCGSSGFFSSTQYDCYNGVDGVTNVLAEYKIDMSVCYYAYCFHTNIVYTTSNTVITMMTCSTGTYYVVRTQIIKYNLLVYLKCSFIKVHLFYYM